MLPRRRAPEPAPAFPSASTLMGMLTSAHARPSISLCMEIEAARIHIDTNPRDICTKVSCLIVEEGADPNEQTLDGETPLMAACLEGPHLLVAVLLANGADPALVTSGGSSALSFALFYNYLPALRMFLHKGGEGVRQLALQIGVERLLEIARLGLEVNRAAAHWGRPMGCDVNAHVKFLLVKRSHTLVCKELTSWFSQQAQAQGNPAAALREADDGSSPGAVGQHPMSILFTVEAMRLAERGDVAALRRVLDNGADVNTTGAYNRTLLINAVVFNQVEVVRLLLGTGRCDLERTCLQGTTALHYAALNGRLRMVQLLIAAGSNVDAREYQDNTALMLACTNGHKEIVSALLAAGADTEIVNVFGNTALSTAASYGACEVISALLDAGVDINSNVCISGTALVIATRNGIFPAVKLLLSRGADPNIADAGDCTPLSWAVQSNNQRIREALLRAGGKSPKLRLEAMQRMAFEAVAVTNLEDIKRGVMAAPIPEGRRLKAMTALGKARESMDTFPGVIGPGGIGTGSGFGSSSSRAGASRVGSGASKKAAAAAAAAAAKAANQPQRSNEEAERIAAELLAEEEAEKAKAQAAKAKKDKKAKQKAELQAAARAGAGGEAAGTTGQQQQQQKKQSVAGASSGLEAGAAAAAGACNSGSAGAGTAATVAGVFDQEDQQGQSAAGTSGSCETGAAVTVIAVAGPLIGTPASQAAGLARLSLGSATVPQATMPAPTPVQPVVPAPPAPSQPFATVASAPTPVQQEEQKQRQTLTTASSAAALVQKQKQQKQKQKQQARGKEEGGSAAHDEQSLCVVCMDAPRSMVLVPCGHVLMCGTCCDAVQRAKNECPLCRAGINLAVILRL